LTDLAKVLLPRREGPVSWDDFAVVMREILAKQDPRYPRNDFASGLVATDAGGVTLGTLAKPTGRDVSVATLFTYIGDAGRAASQRFAFPVQTANKNSVQSSSTILTATSGASTSSISIASHSVKFDFGTVAYNSGSISGLTPETTYLVYASDPAYAGGAVTYLATTNPDNIIASGNYYVGYIVTPITGSSETISAATATNPIAFTTSTTHGWSTGQSVALASLAGGTWNTLNGSTPTITVTGASAFTIAVDGSGLGVYTADTGTATRQTSSTTSGGGGGAGSGGGGSTGTRWDGLANLP
jgi:hypothetical protein